MREEISNRVVKVDELYELINKAYDIIFNVYDENYNFWTNRVSVVRIIDVEKFLPLWNEAMKQHPYKDKELKISDEDMHTYVTTDGLTCLYKYKEWAQYFSTLLN